MLESLLAELVVYQPLAVIGHKKGLLLAPASGAERAPLPQSWWNCFGSYGQAFEMHLPAETDLCLTVKVDVFT